VTLPNQGRYWSDKTSDWTETAEAMAPAAVRFNTLLCDEAGLRPGMRVLDLASGPGEPALTAARRVQPDGGVIATDIVPAMLATLRDRALAADLPVTCTAADMGALPFAPGSFDAVLCRFGLMFLPDPVDSLRRIRTALRPGANLAVMAWGTRAETTLLQVLGDAVAHVLRAPPQDPALDAVFAHGAPGVLTGLFHAAGFPDPAERVHRFAPLLPANRPFWRPQLRMTFGHLLRDLTPAALERLDQDIVARLSAYREGEQATGQGFRLQVTVVTCVAKSVTY